MKKADLSQALNAVKPGLANKEVIEQSSSFVFLGNKVITYNDEISISCPVPGLNLKGAVKAGELYKLLEKIDKEEFDFDIVDNEIQIKFGRGKAGMRIQSEISIPLDEIKDRDDWRELPEGFVRHLQFVMGACSSDMSKPILTCVNVCQDGRMEASDGFRLTRYKGQEIPIEDFLLPHTACPHVVKINPVEVVKSNGWIHFRNQEGVVLSCRIFEDKFPGVETILKISGTEIIFPNTLSNLIDKAIIFSKREHDLDESILITIANNRLTIRGESETGWYEEMCNMKYDKSEIKFSIMPSMFQKILNHSSTAIIAEGDNKIKFTGDTWEHIIMLRKTL